MEAVSGGTHFSTGNESRDRSRQHNGNVFGNVYHSEVVEPTTFGSRKQGYFSPVRFFTESKNSKELILAARDGKLSRVENLLKQTYVNVNFTVNEEYALGQSGKGLSALHSAARNGHTHVACMLLKPWAGADPGLQAGYDCYTPLMSAALFGHDEMIKLLLQNGANVETVVQRPSGDGYDNALTISISHAIARSCMQRFRTAKVLLEHGASPNAQLGKRGGRSRMPMHSAILSGPWAVNLLLGHGARRDSEFLVSDLSLRWCFENIRASLSLHGAAIFLEWEESDINDILSSREIVSRWEDSNALAMVSLARKASDVLPELSSGSTATTVMVSSAAKQAVVRSSSGDQQLLETWHF